LHFFPPPLSSAQTSGNVKILTLGKLHFSTLDFSTAKANSTSFSDAISVVGTVINGKATSVAGDITKGVLSYASEATAGASNLASHLASITSAGESHLSKATGAIASHWSQATSAIESIDSHIDSKYKSITGYSNIESDLRSAIAGGTSNVAAFFSTQTAIAGSAASSIEGDVAGAIISAATASASAPSASASSSSAAGAPRVAAGAIAGVVGILAGILAL
jgi:hypothetical protein